MFAFFTYPMNAAPNNLFAMHHHHPTLEQHRPGGLTGAPARWKYLGLLLLTAVLHATPAQASMFKGQALDTVADVMSWVVLVVAPTVGIAVFWLVHILPEKIAEKKQHPQAKAIQCLCLLSLAFGGLLWPLAWLWAYSKPVLYKMAYGTDKVAHGHNDEAEEIQQFRQRLAELETKMASKPVAHGGKA